MGQATGPGEVALLKRAQALGLPLVETWVVALEEEFFRLNNLPERIGRLFEGVFGVRLDEERLLWACGEAERQVRESYLLPERAEAFLAALKGGGPFLLRRAGSGAFRLAESPQEALFTLKRLWAEAFQVEAVLARYPALLPVPVPLLLQRARGATEDPFLSLDLSRALGQEVVAYTWEGRLVRIESSHGG